MDRGDELSAAGIPYRLALEIIRVQSGQTVSSEHLVALGVSPVAAIELAGQLTTKVYNIDRLLAVGFTIRQALGIGGSGLGNLFPTWIYNLKASNTAKLKAAILAMQAGTRNAFISGTGDSTMAGQINSGNNTIAQTSPMYRAALKLRAAGYATGANANFGYHNGYGNVSNAGGVLPYLVGADSRIAAGGTAAIQGVETAGGLALGSTDNTGYVDLTPVDQITEFDIFYTINTAHSSFQYQVDPGLGGAVTKVDVQAAAAVGKTSVTGLTKGSHTIRHARPDTKVDGTTANPTGPTRIIGVEARDGTRKEISFRNLGISGLKSDGLMGSAVDTQPYTRRKMMQYLAPDATFSNFGFINDALNSYAVATSKANAQQHIIDARTTGDFIIVCPHFINSTTGNAANFADYRAALYQLADEQDCPLIDMGLKFGGSYAIANAAGKMSDGLHPAATGYDDEGTVIAAINRWAVTGVYSETF